MLSCKLCNFLKGKGAQLPNFQRPADLAKTVHMSIQLYMPAIKILLCLETVKEILSSIVELNLL